MILVEVIPTPRTYENLSLTHSQLLVLPSVKHQSLMHYADQDYKHVFLIW